MVFFFFKQKTAYEIKECDWSSDVCSSDLNLFAMIHGATPDECHQVAAALSARVGVDEYRLLFSTREFKKISMSYFME